jgi:hypothetical protein
MVLSSEFLAMLPPFVAMLRPFLGMHRAFFETRRASVEHPQPQRATLPPFAEHR